MMPLDIFYHMFQFIELKHWTLISEIIGLNINNITGSYDIFVDNMDDFLQAIHDKEIHFKHLVFKNVLTDTDGDKLDRCNNITGDVIKI